MPYGKTDMPLFSIHRSNLARCRPMTRSEVRNGAAQSVAMATSSGLPISLIKGQLPRVVFQLAKGAAAAPHPVSAMIAIS